MTRRPRADQWTAVQDAALIATWRFGARAAAAAVNAAGPARGAGSCKARVNRLRWEFGVTIAGPAPQVRGAAGDQARRARAGADKAARKTRACLRCAGDFTSAGPGNRVCGGCKKTLVWRGVFYIPEDEDKQGRALGPRVPIERLPMPGFRGQSSEGRGQRSDIASSLNSGLWPLTSESERP